MVPTGTVSSTLSQTANQPPATSAGAKTLQPDPVRAANELYPPLFDPVAGLAYLPSGYRNSWFVIAYLETADGHKFNCLVHQIINSAPGEPVAIASILNMTDITNCQYRGEERLYAEAEIALATDRMHNTTPSSTITGDHHSISTTADFGWGALELKAEFPGHIMMNGGSAMFNFLGGTYAVQYSIPWGRGSGWLNLDGVRHEVSGHIWFDRQWGVPQALLGQHHKPGSPKDNWVWMDLNLSNGVALGLWDLEISADRHSWVTALYPDGTHVIAAVEPLSLGADAVWTSPTTGQSYPTRFKIRIPALDCVLDVTSVMENQEIVSPTEPKYEGVADISGSFAGEAVTGFTLIEMVGNWRA
jgi:predicted secreted hydrolase